MEYRHVRARLQDVDLGFAGRRPSADPIHGAIAALSPGDPLKSPIGSPGHGELLDSTGRVVVRFARAFQPPPL